MAAERTVLAIGAHPDDVEIGMGGTIAALVAAGHRVTILDLTNGEPTPMGSPERRRAESEEAARVLGVARRITLGLPNRYLEDTVENRTAVAEVIREVRPELLFIPYWVDAHPDHVAAERLSEAARFYAKLTKTEMRGEPFYPARRSSWTSQAGSSARSRPWPATARSSTRRAATSGSWT